MIIPSISQGLDTIYRLLIQPSTHIKEPGERRNARLLSGLLITIILFGLSSGIIQLIFIPDFISSFMFILVAIVILLFCYLASRTQYYKVSAVIASLIPSIAAYSNFVQHPDDVIAIGFMIIGVFLASMLLSLRVTILVASLNIITVIVTPLFVPAIMSEQMIAPVFLVVMFGGLIILAKHHFAAIERDRQAVILQTQTELQKAYNQLENMLTKLPIMVCATNTDEELVIWNDEAKRITGYDSGIMQARGLRGIFYDKQSISGHETTLLGGKEISITNRSGKEKIISYFDMSADFSIPGWKNWGVGLDITNHKDAENTRVRFAIEQEKTEVLRQMVGNLSHDLKTPLSIIMVNLSLIERIDDPQRQGEKLEQIKRQSIHLRNLIQDVLTIARLDHIPEQSFTPVRLDEFVRETALQLEPLAQEKGLSFETRLNSENVTLELNSNSFSRMLLNLIENAIMYTDEGAISISTDRTGTHVEIQIADTGIGITEAELPQIFERFYRADVARSTKSGGTGLGLSIAKQIIDQHGGTIDVESRPGTGTTFLIKLPCKRPQS